MGWKSWPSWLKGGIIGLIFALIVSGAVIILDSLFRNWLNSGGIIPLLLLVFNIIGVIIIFSMGIGAAGSNFNLNFLGYSIVLFSSLISYFVIGALIGWIIGKIKKK